MIRKANRFKKGAASFYIIAFSTLILMIIAMSFAAIIISEVTRTSNDDLSQSAYDSALAGVEDAKIAFANYRNCKMLGATAAKPDVSGDLSCPAIVWLMEEGGEDNSFNDCDMVSAMLGRKTGEGTEIKEIENSNNGMSQAYTCVKIKKDLPNYTGNVSSASPIKVVRVKFADGVEAKDINNVTIRWFSSDDANKNGNVYNFNNIIGNKVAFPSNKDEAATPPTISLTMVQTAGEFNLSDFDMATSNEATGQTDRGTVYLVPYKENSIKDADNYNVVKPVNGMNKIGADAFNLSNSKMKNLPYAVKCLLSNDSEYACSVNITLPEPKSGSGARNNETFMFVVALPYGRPDTSFSLEFYCRDGNVCSKTVTSGGETQNSSLAILDGVQIEVDSTGRANDLYRRVKARLESQDAYALSIMGPLELSGDSGNDTVLQKNYTVTRELNF